MTLTVERAREAQGRRRSGKEEMNGRSLVFSTCLAIFGLATMTCPPAAAAEQAASQGDQMVDGVWASRGYGWVWEISDGSIKRFDVGDGFCIPKHPGDNSALTPYNKAELSDRGQTLRLRLQDPDYFYTFDRIAGLPASCQQPASTAPEFVFGVVVEMFDTHYAFFEERGVDWTGTVERARSRLRPEMTDADLVEVLQELLAPFGDSHVGIEAEIDGVDASISGAAVRRQERTEGRPAVEGAWNSRAAVAVLEYARRSGDGTLLHGLLADDVGYLRVQAMWGMEAPELEAALDEAMIAFAGTKAVIVDVSENYGGLDSFARLIARRFAAEPTIAYAKYAGDHQGDTPQKVVLRPPERPRYLGPVYLITSRHTVSAAEIFVISMRALPTVVHLGEATDGSLSDELWKTLPNGWTLSLSNEVYLDSEGVLWEGRGIPPEIPLAISDSATVAAEDEQAVLDLLDFIRLRL